MKKHSALAMLNLNNMCNCTYGYEDKMIEIDFNSGKTLWIRDEDKRIYNLIKNAMINHQYFIEFKYEYSHKNEDEEPGDDINFNDIKPLIIK